MADQKCSAVKFSILRDTATKRGSKLADHRNAKQRENGCSLVVTSHWLHRLLGTCERYSPMRKLRRKKQKDLNSL